MNRVTIITLVAIELVVDILGVFWSLGVLYLESVVLQKKCWRILFGKHVFFFGKVLIHSKGARTATAPTPIGPRARL
jgi:hypothetical protein